MSASPRWTPDEDAALERWYPEYGTKCKRWACNGGELLTGRSRKAINIRACKLGVGCRYHGPRVWPHAHDRMALAMLADVCRETGRTPYQVLRHLHSLVESNRKRSRGR